MASDGAFKIFSYVMAAAMIVAGIMTGNPLLVAQGVAQAAGTAMASSPPRQKTLRDSPTYGLGEFRNPRGAEALVPILYGTAKIRPAVIAESVMETSEGVSPGDARNTRQQEFRWLGVVAEGEVVSIDDVKINDRRAVSRWREVTLGTGDGQKKQFDFPSRWVYLGDDEAPDPVVSVDGTVRSWKRTSAVAEFVMPADKSVTVFEITRDVKTDRILSGTVTMRVRGPGYAEVEQQRRSGLFKWSAAKIAKHRLRVRFKTRPPAGYVVRVAYDVLTTDGLAIVQTARGETKAVFGKAPTNGQKITARFRTTPFPALRLVFRPGTLDQQPIDGFTDLEVSRNPTQQTLTRNAAVSYSTSGRDIDDVRIGLIAPRGLVQYKDDGGTRSVSVEVRIEYRRSSSASWTTLRSASGSTFTLIGERANAMRFDISLRDELEWRAIAGETGAEDALASFTRGPIEVRVTRLTAVATDSLVIDELLFAYVTEVLREGYTYPGTALLGIRGRVAAFLDGQSLDVTCVATRGNLYDPRSAPVSDERDIGSSANPALAIRDLITSSEGAASERFGGGYFFGAADFATGSGDGLAAFADWCDEWVHRPGDDATKPASSTNGERRCRLGLVLDTPSSLMEAVGDIAFLGYCFAVAQGAKWRFPLDRDGDPVFTFVDDVDPAAQNCSKVLLRMDAWGKTPTAMQGSFWPASLDYDRDELMHPVDVPEGTPTNIKQTDLRGITRETEAARILRHLAEQAREMPFPVTWEAHPGVQHLEAGDIVEIRTRVPYSTGSSALTLKVRVLAAVIGRDEQGKFSTRFTGRVMAQSALALQAATVPAPTRRATATTVQTTERRAVTGLSARVR